MDRKLINKTHFKKSTEVHKFIYRTKLMVHKLEIENPAKVVLQGYELRASHHTYFTAHPKVIVTDFIKSRETVQIFVAVIIRTQTCMHSGHN